MIFVLCCDEISISDALFRICKPSEESPTKSGRESRYSNLCCGLNRTMPLIVVAQRAIFLHIAVLTFVHVNDCMLRMCC